MSKFCETCGAMLQDAERFCSACGAQQPMNNGGYQNNADSGGYARPAIPRSAPKPNTGKKVALITMICAAVLVLFYFLPQASAGAFGYNVSLSAAGLTFGKNIKYLGVVLYRTPAKFLFIFQLLVPLAVLALPFLKKVEALQKFADFITIGLSVLGLLILIIGGGNTFWYFLSYVLYIVIGGLAVLQRIDKLPAFLND